MIHTLKIWSPSFEAVYHGRKLAELRVDDRPYTAGDMLRLREWQPLLGEVGRYTGRELEVRILHVARGPSWPIPEGLVLLSIGRVRVLPRRDPEEFPI
jgi:hypothetical protein